MANATAADGAELRGSGIRQEHGQYRDRGLGGQEGDDCIIAAGIINLCTKTVNNTVWQTLNSFGEPPIVGSISDTANYSNIVGDALALVVQQTCESIVLL